MDNNPAGHPAESQEWSEMRVDSQDLARASTRRASVILGALLLVCGCGGAERERAGIDALDAVQSPNVLFILIDTLRADHMSLYGYERPTTPFLDEFGKEAAVFQRARSQAACTFPSVNSFLTSRYAFDFYKQSDVTLGISEEFPSLPELFRDAGYTTAAVSASPIVRANPSEENPDGGFGRGFGVFDESCVWEDAACVNARAVPIISHLEQPYFAYLHFLDPHGRYSPPSTWEQEFTGPYDGYQFVSEGNPNPIGEMLYNGGPAIEISERDIGHLKDLYDEEIRYIDAQLRSLFTALEGTGQLDNTVVVITSDHGEEFLEHGHVKHCRGVWDTLTRVPLIVSGPGIRPNVIEGAVQLVDLAPTLLDVARIPFEGFGFQGITILETLETGEFSTGDQLAFSDQGRYRSADDGRFKVILDGDGMKVQLFNIAVDPLEQEDLRLADHTGAKRLADELWRWLDETGQTAGLDRSMAANKKTEERLRALGYLE